MDPRSEQLIVIVISIRISLQIPYLVSLAHLLLYWYHGLPEHNKYEYGPLAGCQSYTNYLTKLAVYGSDAEILTAILVDFPVWGANCDKMSSALKKNYGFTNTSCAFLDNFAAPLPREFVEKSNDIVGPALKTKEKEMRIAARLLLGYELSFWDTINKHSAIPDWKKFICMVC